LADDTYHERIFAIVYYRYKYDVNIVTFWFLEFIAERKIVELKASEKRAERPRTV
jgi:hypothetical protein